jgi:hypothetical protein
MYTSKVRGWLLSVSFESGTISKDGILILKSISGKLSKPPKIIRIRAGKCRIFAGRKVAYLCSDVSVHSNGFDAKTANICVDWHRGTISGNSQITGKIGVSRFIAKGFSINEDGKVMLKNMKILRDSPERKRSPPR